MSPAWFNGGIFIGAGPWYRHFGYGYGGYRGVYGYRGGYGYRPVAYGYRGPATTGYRRRLSPEPAWLDGGGFRGGGYRASGGFSWRWISR